MVETELKKLLTQIQNRHCAGQTIEVKSAHGGCPEKLYDTLSAFSNQDSGAHLCLAWTKRLIFPRSVSMMRRICSARSWNTANR